MSAAERTGSPAASMLMVPALNAMIDITTTRIAATRVHPPVIIFVMLFGLALASALLAGYGMASADDRPWVHMVGLAAALALTVYVILDVEFPRYGLIRVDDFDDLLVDVRSSMK